MKVLMLEFWGSFNRYSLNLAEALCKLKVELTLVSVEDCIEEPLIPYKLIKIFPSFDKRNGRINKFYRYIRSYLFLIRLAQ